MALTDDSVRTAAQRKARQARQKVQAAERELEAANETLKAAIPRRDVEAIARAADRTAHAEDEVREAAHDLELVDRLLEPGQAGPQRGAAAGTTGEGVRSLLRVLRQHER